MTVGARALGLLGDLDLLYESVVLDASAWDDAAFGEWMESAVPEGEGWDREALKILRRAVRRAQRLQRYWEGRSSGPADWRMRVDEALGSAAWRPGLELVEWAMDIDPSPDLYAELEDRFRAVHFQPLAVPYEEYLGAVPKTD